ncbi:MAG: hypothetical protein ACYCWE_15805 [Eubacteriales bacterium]
MLKKYYSYLLYLILITFVITAATFSGYRTTMVSSAQIKVAKPVLLYTPVSAVLNGVPVTDITNGINITGSVPGDILVYQFNITNYDGIHLNDVTMKYKVNVAFNPSDAVLPFTYTLQPAASYSADGEGYTYLNTGVQLTHGYTLTVTWPSGDKSPEYWVKTQNISIQISSEQVD